MEEEAMGRIVVFGAGGKAGEMITDEAAQRGHSVTATVRDLSNVPAFAEGVNEITGDPTDMVSVRALAEDEDVFIVAVGGADNTVWLRAAQTLIETREAIPGQVPRILHMGGSSSVASRSLGILKMVGFACAGLSVLLPLSSRIFAQSTCPNSPPPYGLLRQDEDYRYLSNPTCRHDYWDHLKYVPLGANEDRYLTFGGEIREWYEGFRNASWGLGTQDHDSYLLQRLSTYFDIHAAPRLRFFVQLTSAIEAGRTGGPRPVTDESKLFVEEGFADIALSNKSNKPVGLRLVRQQFELCSGRFVDVREGPNVRQAFDGASL